jgi:hypothetical protein
MKAWAIQTIKVVIRFRRRGREEECNLIKRLLNRWGKAWKRNVEEERGSCGVESISEHLSNSTDYYSIRDYTHDYDYCMI